jgi:glycosyltransferase involved in cell wall biosynthesis
MKDVLCIGYSCPPILDPQSILLAKMLRPLREHGYLFHVVALDPASCQVKTDASLVSLLPADTRVARVAASEQRLWFRALGRAMPSLLRMPDKHATVHLRALRAARALAGTVKPSALFSWAQYHSCSLVALRLKERLGLPWVAHFSDPWHLNPYRRPGFAERWVNARLERAVVSAADAIVFVNEETRDATLERYPRRFRDKAHVIPHCFEPQLYPPERTPHAGIVFRHIGHFYGARGIRPLLEAIRALRGAKPGVLDGVTFELIGRIREPEVADVRALGLDGLVRLRPGVGYRESLREMRDADVLLLVEAPAGTNLFLPSKVVDYLGSGTPIVALTPPQGPAARLLSETGDAVVAPDDVRGIADALARRIESCRDGGASPRRREPIARLEARATMGELADVFRQLDGGTS